MWRPLALLLALPSVAAAQNVVTDPFPGVRVTERVADGQRIYIVAVDLCQAGIAVRGTRPEERGATVPAWAERVGVDVAVNGNFFTPGNFAEIDGWAAGDGQRWGGADHGYVAAVAFGPGRVDTWAHEEELGHFWGDWTQQIVSGHPTLVAEGQVRDNQGDGTLCPRHPRTAVGFSEDWRTLIIAVVDGRDAPSAVGMTCLELAQVMAFIGARNAVNLDGGGSSTLWIRGRGVVNRPSDGRPRTVSTHFGVYARGQGAAAHCMRPQAPCDAQPDFRGCDGNFITSCHHTQLDRGDCGVFGLTCSDRGGPARCVDPRCATGDRTWCATPAVIGTCAGDVYSEGNCGMFGASCGEDAAGAFCVHPFCPAADGTLCVDERVLRTCRRGQLEETACAADRVCRGGACVDPDAPPPPDAATSDAAPPDATAPDATAPDAAVNDAAAPDTALADAAVARPDAAPAAPDACGGGASAEGGCGSAPPEAPGARYVDQQGGCAAVATPGAPWIAALLLLGRRRRRGARA